MRAGANGLLLAGLMQARECRSTAAEVPAGAGCCQGTAGAAAGPFQSGYWYLLLGVCCFCGWDGEKLRASALPL